MKLIIAASTGAIIINMWLPQCPKVRFFSGQVTPLVQVTPNDGSLVSFGVGLKHFL